MPKTVVYTCNKCGGMLILPAGAAPLARCPICANAGEVSVRLTFDEAEILRDLASSAVPAAMVAAGVSTCSPRSVAVQAIAKLTLSIEHARRGGGA